MSGNEHQHHPSCGVTVRDEIRPDESSAIVSGLNASHSNNCSPLSSSYSRENTKMTEVPTTAQNSLTLSIGAKKAAITTTIPDRNQLPLSCVVKGHIDGGGEEVVVGGLVGSTCWNWLSVKYLWVDDSQRGRGVGKALMLAAEDRARKRGCIGSHVDTFSFQAKDFYLKLGYIVVGEIEDFPIGHTRIYLKKRLDC